MLIKVETTGITALIAAVKQRKAQMESAARTVSQVQSGLDMEIAATGSIEAKLNSISKRIQRQIGFLDQYAALLQQVNDRFAASDKKISNEAKAVNYLLAKAAVSSLAGGAGSSLAMIRDTETIGTSQGFFSNISNGQTNGANALLGSTISIAIAGAGLAALANADGSVTIGGNTLTWNNGTMHGGGGRSDAPTQEEQKFLDTIAELDELLAKDISKMTKKELEALKKRIQELEAELKKLPMFSALALPGMKEARELIHGRIEKAQAKIAAIDSQMIKMQDAAYWESYENAQGTVKIDNPKAYNQKYESGCGLTASAYALSAIGCTISVEDAYNISNKGRKTKSVSASWGKIGNATGTTMKWSGDKRRGEITFEELAAAVQKANKNPNSSPVVLLFDPPAGYWGAKDYGPTHYVVVKSVVRDSRGNITHFIFHEGSVGKDNKGNAIGGDKKVSVNMLKGSLINYGAYIKK